MVTWRWLFIVSVRRGDRLRRVESSLDAEGWAKFSRNKGTLYSVARCCLSMFRVSLRDRGELTSPVSTDVSWKGAWGWHWLSRADFVHCHGRPCNFALAVPDPEKVCNIAYLRKRLFVDPPTEYLCFNPNLVLACCVGWLCVAHEILSPPLVKRCRSDCGHVRGNARSRFVRPLARHHTSGGGTGDLALFTDPQALFAVPILQKIVPVNES